MKKCLRFNICELETSYNRNDKISDLATRIENAILVHLSYSCRFWAEHLQSIAFHSTVLMEVLDFMENRFLYWLEVLSVKNWVGFAASALIQIEGWADVSFDIIFETHPYH